MNLFLRLKRGDKNATAFFFGVITLFIQAISQFFYPNILGVDSYIRLVNHDYLFIRHWLPGFQIIVKFTFLFEHYDTVLLIVLVLISSLTVVAFYKMCREMLDDKLPAFLAALALILFVQFLQISRMPYIESLTLLLISLSFFFFETRRPYAGSMAYFLACLTRQEAWFLLPILWWLHAKKTKTNFSAVHAILASCVLFGILMMVFHPSHHFFDPYIQFNSFLENLSNQPFSYFFITPFMIVATFVRENIFLLFAALPGMYVFIKEKSEKLPYVFIVLTLFLVALGNGLAIEMYWSRHYLLTSVFLLPFVFYGFQSIKNKSTATQALRFTTVILFVFVLVVNFSMYFFTTSSNSISESDKEIEPYRLFGQSIRHRFLPEDKVLVSYGKNNIPILGASAFLMRDIYYSGYDMWKTYIPFEARSINSRGSLKSLFYENKANYILIDKHDVSKEFESLLQSSNIKLVHSDDTIGQFLYAIEENK